MAKLGGRNCCSRWGMCPGNMVCSDACQCELQQDDRSRMGGTSQPYITGIPSSGVIGPASGIGFSGGYRNASGSVVSTTPQSGGHYTQAEGDALCSGQFGGGSTMSHYNCVQNPQHSAAYDCTIYCNSTVPGQPPMALETVLDTSPVRGRGPRKGVDRYRNASGKMGFASSLGLVGVIGIFGALYLLNRYLDAQPKR